MVSLPSLISYSERQLWKSDVTRISDALVRKTTVFPSTTAPLCISAYQDVLEFMHTVQHPYICRHFKPSVEQIPGKRTVMRVEMEAMGGSLQYFYSQPSCSLLWAESELVNNLDGLLSALASARRKVIPTQSWTHRQVTLSHILLSEDGKLFKLSSFAPKRSREEETEERVYWSRSRQERQDAEDQDLYALGISFLMLAYFPNKSLPSDIESGNIPELLTSLNEYPELQWRLKVLLQHESPQLDIWAIQIIVGTDRKHRQKPPILPNSDECQPATGAETTPIPHSDLELNRESTRRVRIIQGEELKEMQRQAVEQSELYAPVEFPRSSEPAPTDESLPRIEEEKEAAAEKQDSEAVPQSCVECGATIGKFVSSQKWTRKVLLDHRQCIEVTCSFDCFYQLFTSRHELEFYCHFCFQHFRRRADYISEDAELTASFRIYCSRSCVQNVENVVLEIDAIGECGQCRKRIDFEGHKKCFALGCGNGHMVCGVECLQTVLRLCEQIRLEKAVCPVCNCTLREDMLARWGYCFPIPETVSLTVRETSQDQPEQSPIRSLPTSKIPIPPTQSGSKKPLAQSLLDKLVSAFTSQKPSVPNSASSPLNSDPRQSSEKERACVKCNAEGAEVTLGCGHYVCRKCIESVRVSTHMVVCTVCNENKLVIEE